MKTFVTYQVAVELVRDHIRPLVPIVKRFDCDLADQMHRAATSLVLNLAEGARSSGGNQKRHYDIAHGSANEVKGCLDLCEAWGWIEVPLAARAVLDRELGLLWGLTHSRMRKTPAQAQ